MPYVTSVRTLGDALTVFYDDGSQQQAMPTGHGIWLVSTAIGANPSDPTPADPTGGGTVPAGTIYNPWDPSLITDGWAVHVSRGSGGVDWAYGYGTAIKAPSAGTLQSNSTGGLSDVDTGWVGTAGRRSILHLDVGIPRTKPMETGEAGGDMVAIVFQHQSKMGTNGAHFAKGATVGLSGASASGSDYGGDVHLHVHGLNASGGRVNFLNFIP